MSSSAISSLRKKILKNDGGVNTYSLVNSYDSTSMEKLQLKDSAFRVFDVVKPESGRKLNTSGSAFDIYNDSLMDYPTIIQAKLGGSWEQYNRLLSVQIPVCPMKCWHCYIDKDLLGGGATEYFSAENIVDKFIVQRNFDKSIGVLSNVLRITGGEPFLIPELILEVLQTLEEKGLSSEIFVWTETNLYPFAKDPTLSFSNKANILDEISKFKNIAIHPCFHGTNSDNLFAISRVRDEELSSFVGGIKELTDRDIEIYPTIGSNVCEPKSLPDLFRSLNAIRKDLPLRLALINYDFEYEPVIARLKNSGVSANLYSKYQNIRIWDALLKDNYGIGYGVIPRHLATPSLVDDCSKPSADVSDYSPKEDCVYVFKSSYRENYHQEVLELLALPKGFIYKIEYDSKYVQKDFGKHMELRPEQYVNKKGTFIYSDQNKRILVPLRNIKIKKVDMKKDTLVLYMELGDYFSLDEKKAAKDEVVKFNEGLKKLFGERTVPPGGRYVLLGEDIDGFSQSNAKQDEIEAWRRIVNLLQTMKCSKFERSLFYKVEFEMNLEESKNGNEIKSCYMAKGGEKVLGILHYYHPNYDKLDLKRPNSRTVTFEPSSDIIKATTSNEITLSKYGSDYIKFTSDLFTGDDQEVNLFFRAVDDPFNAPKLSIPFLLKGSNVTGGFVGILPTIFLGFGGAWLGMIKGLFKNGEFVGTSGILSFLLIMAVFFLIFGGVFKQIGKRYKVY